MAASGRKTVSGPVPPAPVEMGRFCRVDFDPVSPDAMRPEVRLPKEHSSGIPERIDE
jgi:hypothetical protein